MTRAKPTPERRTRSGATQPEAERKAGQVLLRLLPRTRAALDAIARRLGVSRSQAVTQLVEDAQR